MTIRELDDHLRDAVSNFSDEIRSQYDDYSKDAALKGDIAELSRQTFYALDKFREEIINYLKSHQ